MSIERGLSRRSEQRSKTNYERYMQFPGPVENPWTEQFLDRHLRGIGIPEPQVTDADVDRLRNSYDLQPPSRVYHGTEHAAFVGTPHIPDALAERLTVFSRSRAESAVARAGGGHDRVYPKVDVIEGTTDRLWSSAVREDVGGMADCQAVEKDGRQIFMTRITEEGKNDPVTQMVAHIFGINDEIAHTEGGSEFASALADAKSLERQGKSSDQLTSAEKRDKALGIITNTVLIAGTVPFETSVERDETGAIIGDGSMGKLSERVRTVCLTLHEETFQPDWETQNDIMMLTTHFANRDISPLIAPDNVAGVIRGGRQLKKEEIPVLRQGVTTMDGLVQSVGREAGPPLLYTWIGSNREDAPVSAEKVPSVCFARDEHGEIIPGTLYPPPEVYEQAVVHTLENCSLGDDFNRAHESGVCLSAAIATLVDESHVATPGFVDSTLWHRRALPRGERFDHLDSGEELVYQELMHGTNQQDVDSATPKRSPIGGMLFGVLGSEGIQGVSDAVQEIRNRDKSIANPFADVDVAREYVQLVREQIGEENFRTIITELHRVAIAYQDDPFHGTPERAERLEALVDGNLRVYKA
jgi:hypothetical protein